MAQKATAAHLREADSVSREGSSMEMVDAKTKPEVSRSQTKPEEVVLFTSFDGAVREVGDLPLPLGRTTALASEKTTEKIWGTSQEDAACHAMQKGT